MSHTNYLNQYCHTVPWKLIGTIGKVTRFTKLCFIVTILLKEVISILEGLCLFYSFCNFKLEFNRLLASSFVSSTLTSHILETLIQMLQLIQNLEIFLDTFNLPSKNAEMIFLIAFEEWYSRKIIISCFLGVIFIRECM